jgi:hypothetical protein
MTTSSLLPGSAKLPNRDRNSHLYALALLAVLFYLPYFIPQRPVASDSYLFGFNNRAAIVLLLVFSAGAALWGRGYNLALRPAGQPTKIAGRTLGICLAIQLAACLAMVLLAGGFGGFCESTYEIDRVWLLAQGHLPYVGFEWPFGVLFLYGPLWLSHLFHGDIAQGYNAFWTLSSVAGVALLFATINRLDTPTPRKTFIFLILFVAFLPSVLGMGAHYTLLRYISPFYCILIVSRASTGNTRRRAQRLAAALAVCFTAMLLLISPEMAIAHAFACSILLFPRKSAISPAGLRPSPYAAMLAGLAALFAAALKLHLLDTLIASGGGADSFPIPFSVPVLFFYAVVFVCACSVVRRWAEPSLTDNSIALIVLSIPLLAAALGRCDPGHILSNGVGLMLAVFLYASGSPRMWRLYCSAFIVAMIAIPGYTVCRAFLPRLGVSAMRTAAEETMPGVTGLRASIAEFGIRHMPSSDIKSRWLCELARLRVHVVPATIDFASLYPGLNVSRPDGNFEAPFGYQPNGFGSYHSSAVDYGYYEGMENANTPHAVQRKIDELAQHPDRDLLLPDASASLCSVDGSLQRGLLSVFFFFPYLARVSHPVSVHQPLCDYIAEHYTLARSATPNNFEYELWTPAKPSVLSLK